ncbi:DUF4410 domain-containing protein [Pararobbsia silviterrae]|uniref:DUF4410 domain-containing protein n=2 Tax=Pararobbsia silviterrae TaxID=1792498 RepID=A0A494XZV1_9BURK|nr:DUF4410 domain-containing protein [Pararobbsia silviterrae]
MSWNLRVGKMVRHIGAALVLSSALMSGCASSHVTSLSEQPAALGAAPATIYVSAFDIASSEVKVDEGGMLRKLAAGSNDEQAQRDAAAQTRDDIADQTVAALARMGLHAVRLDGPVPSGQNALVVTGQIGTVDEGNRRRRLVIGLGAGKSEVSATVQIVYRASNGATHIAQSFDASADSGHAPGLAETAGVGAAAGHVATAAVTGTGLHAVSENKRGSVSAQSRGIAESIAKQVAQLGTVQGWYVARPS